jgi:TP901 family phage tail tape measure protein
MPGQLLTLDLIANDQASDNLARVSGQVGHLSEEMQRLLAMSRAFDAQAKRATAGTAQQVRAQAQLINANAKLETSTARQLRSSAQLTAAQAKEVRSINALVRAETALAKSKGQSKGPGADLVGTRAGSAILDRLSGGAASASASYGSLGPAVIGAGLALKGFDIAATAAQRSLSLQVDALKSATLAAAKFDYEIQRVAAITGNAAGSFDLLREAALKGGASTQFTAQQAGEALRFLAQAGLTATQATQALPGALQLAAAGNLDLARAADIATNILTGYNFQVSELGRVNDVLVKAANSSNTNVQELGTAFSYTAGVAAATGQEFESIVGVLEVLANNGIKASKSGRAVANAISRIEKPTAAGRAVLDQLGISLTTAEGRTKDLVTVLKEFEGANASAAQTLTFFGEVAGRSLITVLNSGTSAIDKYAAANKRAAGTAAAFERAIQNTAQGQLTILQSTLETLSITVGSRFLPALKEVSRVLTAQVAPLATNTEFLRQFDIIAQGAVIAFADLLDGAALLAPGFARIGGLALDLSRILTILARSVLITSKSIKSAFTADLSSIGDSLQLLKENYVDAIDIVTSGGRNLAASGKIGDQLALSLSNAANGVRGVNLAFGEERKVLDQVTISAKSALRAFGEFVGPQGESKNIVEFTGVLNAFSNSLQQTATSITAFLGAGRPKLDTNADPGLDAKREEARLEAEIANATDARQRAELEYQKEILSLSQQELDDEVLGYKQLEAFAKLNAAIRAANAASRKASAKSRGEDISAKLTELRIAQQLLSADDRRLQLSLTYQQTIIRINASKDADQLKDLQRQNALIELQRGGLALEVERASQRRAASLAVDAELTAQGKMSALLLVERERRAALAELAAESGLDDQVRAQRERLINLEAERKTTEAIARLRQTEAARAASFDAVTLSSLAQRQDAESKIAALKIESAQRSRQIVQEETDAITRQNKLRLEQEQTERNIAQIRMQAALARTESIRSGVSAGAGTDTSGLAGQFAAESGAALELQVRSLEIAKQQAEVRGLDTAFMERRIQQLREEADAQRAVTEAQLAQIEGTAMLASGVVDLGTRLADLATIGFDSAEGYAAMGAAISAAAGLGAALAQGLGLSAKAAAKVQVAFNAAAAIASFAAYAASGFTAGNFLTSSIQYGLAAAKFGLVAGVSGGGSSRGGGGGSGGSGATFSAPTFDAAAERDKTAQAFARALRDQLEKPVQQIINLDFRRATLLESSPAVGREINSAVGAAQRSVYQSGQRRSG